MVQRTCYSDLPHQVEMIYLLQRPTIAYQSGSWGRQYQKNFKYWLSQPSFSPFLVPSNNCSKGNPELSKIMKKKATDQEDDIDTHYGKSSAQNLL
jgi:hypothetical protein